MARVQESWGDQTDTETSLHQHGDSAQTGVTSVEAASLGTVAQLADYLVNGFWNWWGYNAHHWGSSTVSVNIQDLTAAEQSLAASALNAWHEVSNINFTYTAGSAQITFYNNPGPNGSARASTSSSWNNSTGIMSSATINISSNWWPNTNIYSYMYQTYLHEIGHALGLGHQGPYNGSADYGVDNVFTNDTWQYSVMSYFSQDNFGGSSFDFVITPEMADITAVQSIYGAASTRTGDTTYGFNSNAGSIYNFASYSGTPALTIYDSGGTDTLDSSGYSAVQTINLTPGAWSSIGGYINNIGIFTTTLIENAIGGSGADTIAGNSANNMLRGRGGNDSINGASGIDSAVFSGLRSAYSLTDLGGGSIRVSGPDGTDTLASIERLLFDDATLMWPIGPVSISAAGDFNGGGTYDYAWRDAGAFMTLWQYDAAAQQVTQAGLGTVGFSWRILASDHFSNASTDQMLAQSVPDGTMSLWWVNSSGQRDGVDIGKYWNGINYLTNGEFTDNGGTGIANFLVANAGDHHLYDWWIDSSNHLQGIDLGAVWSNKSLLGTGEFTPNGGTDFLVANAGDHHLYDWWIDPTSHTLQGYDLGAAWNNVGYIASGDFSGGGNDDFLVFNAGDRHLYNWWIDPVSHTLQGMDLGAAWNNVQFLASGHFHDGTSNDQILVRNTANSDLYVWWIDSSNHLQGINLGPQPGIDLIDTGHFNDMNGSTTNDEWLVRNAANGHFYEWWLDPVSHTLQGYNLGESLIV